MKPLINMVRQGYENALKAAKKKSRVSEPVQPKKPVKRRERKRYPQSTVLTPNRSPNAMDSFEGVVLHHCGGTPQGTTSWILNSESNVSYHIYIYPNGKRIQFVPYKDAAWHAGRSSWRGKKWCNRFTVGVAFSGDTYQRMPTEDEIASFAEWWAQTAPKFGWTLEDITTHRNVSPNRKNDTSPEFTEALLGGLK